MRYGKGKRLTFLFLFLGEKISFNRYGGKFNDIEVIRRSFCDIFSLIELSISSNFEIYIRLSLLLKSFFLDFFYRCLYRNFIAIFSYAGANYLNFHYYSSLSKIKISFTTIETDSSSSESFSGFCSTNSNSLI